MNRTVLKLAIPSIFANITVPLVGMADPAIAGRMGDASVLGGIAIASMLFDLLYWNMGFLRMGTGGMVAQAYGRRDFREAMNVYALGMATALGFAFLFLALQYLYVEVAFRFIECSPQVEVFGQRVFLHKDLGCTCHPFAQCFQRFLHRYAECCKSYGSGCYS